MWVLGLWGRNISTELFVARAAASVTTQEHYGDARHDTQADENPDWNCFREVPWMMKTGFQHLCDLWKAHLTRDRHLGLAGG